MTFHSFSRILASVHALLLKAWRDLTKRRIRSLLTIGAIAIGVAGIVAIVSTAQNLTRAQADAYLNASQADITFWVWDAPPQTARALSELPNVAGAELRNNYFTKCKWAGQLRDVNMWGLNFSTQSINQIQVLGSPPNPGQFLVESSVRDLFPISIGDTISCRARDSSTLTLVLAGFAQSPNYPTASILDFATIYANAEDVQRLLGIAGANQALLKVNDLTKARETANDATKLFSRRAIDHDGGNIRDPQNYLGKRELDALFVLLTVFSAVGLVSSAFLVANTLAAMTSEQVGEIGVLKAIGSTRGQVLSIYLIAAMMYGGAGTILGIVLGAVASWQLLGYIGALLNLNVGFVIAPQGIGLGALVGIVVTAGGGFIPSFTATRIRVKDALEAYGITSTYGLGRVDRVVQKVLALPPLVAMSLRNLARRKSRSIITTMVIAVAVAASLAAQSTSASVENAIDGLFRTYRADAWVWFDQWVGTNFAGNFRSADGVQTSEVWSLADAWVGSDRVRVWGLPLDTQLYSPRMAAGRWFNLDDVSGAVISTDLADKLHLRVGDSVPVEIAQERRDLHVVGILIDNSIFLGSTVSGKIFMDERVVEKMQDREGWTTFFALGFDDHDPAMIDQRLSELQERYKKFQVGSDSAYREVRGAKEQSRILGLALAAMSLLVGAMGALGVLNTLTLNVLERRREIGVLRSIGAGDGNIAQIFLTEGLSLGLGGWVVGLLIGYPLGMVFVNVMGATLFQMDYIFSPAMVGVSLLFALAIAILASIAPAIGAARMRVGQVLRYE